VWGTRLDPIAKVAIIAIAWGGVAIAGTVIGSQQDSQARALGCIDIAKAPKNYYTPFLASESNNCPMGYEPGPNWKPPPTAATPAPPSTAAQTAACAGHDGPETGPDFPPPTYDKSSASYIVLCMDSTYATVPVH
jgi:hypothetical protein